MTDLAPLGKVVLISDRLNIGHSDIFEGSDGWLLHAEDSDEMYFVSKVTGNIVVTQFTPEWKDVTVI